MMCVHAGGVIGVDPSPLSPTGLANWPINKWASGRLVQRRTTPDQMQFCVYVRVKDKEWG